MIEDFDKIYQQVYDQSPGTVDPVYYGSQIKSEFIQAWNELIGLIQKTEGTFTFLEIGAYRGLWPLMLSYVCESLGKSFEYTTVTWLDQDPNNEGIHKVFKYYEDRGLSYNLINKNSQTQEARDAVEDSYDVVFIDADHRYEGVKRDIELYSELATKVLMFHDIRPVLTTQDCGVFQAISDCGISIDKEIVVDGSKMGIGFSFVDE